MASPSLSSPLSGEQPARMTPRRVSRARQVAGRWLIAGSSGVFSAVVLVQALHTTEIVGLGFDNWRPALYAFLLGSTAPGVGLVLIRGDLANYRPFLLLDLQ